MTRGGSSTLRTVLVGLGAFIAIVALVGGIGWAIWADAKDKSNQLNDHRADLVAVGFVNPQPVWEDETHGNKTESTLETIVTVAGCRVELERPRDTEGVAATVKGRAIETYTAAEVHHAGKETDINGPSGAPDSKAIEAFLKEHKNRFTCYTATAA